MKVILSINAGSSSVKLSVYTVEGLNAAPRQIADAQITGLTAPPAKLEYSRTGPESDSDSGSGKTVVKQGEQADNVKSQGDAFSLLLQTLVDDGELPQVSSSKDISVACHRIVHGGDYDDAKLITTDTYRHIEELSDLAPLHNGPALGIVDACMGQLPAAANVACFDSQFHSSIPPHISTYPIDQHVARKNRLRKYGFHGISYAFIARSVAGFLDKEPEKLNIIALHLGSGASACAIKGGKSWDTSMGLTPLAGLPGATRSGTVDPSLVFHYASDVGKLSPSSTSQLHISKAEEILNKQSGWSSLTGTTDFATIASSAATDPAHKLAFDLLVDRICGYIGAYYVSLRGQVDALVFAGGIGEKSDQLRAAVAEGVACLGFRVDEAKNGAPVEGVVSDIGHEATAHRLLVCQTDEQLEMARACAAKKALWS